MSISLSRRQFIGMSATLTSALGLTACGSTTTPTNAGSATTAFPKSYIIATDTTFAPFEYTDENGNFVGIDVDLLAAIAKNQGFEYELQSLGFDAAMAAVESNQADAIIAGMSITEKRKEDYDFSDPYYDAGVCCASKDGGDYPSLESLKGTTVAAKTATNGANWAESIKDQYQFTITYFDDSSLMYQDVLTGNSTACFEDFPVMSYNVQQGNGLQIIAKDEEEFFTPYGFAVLKGQNPELLAAFNAGLAALRESDEYDTIINTYLKG
jgi:ABC-type amino acid transport substrate-binding protein